MYNLLWFVCVYVCVWFVSATACMWRLEADYPEPTAEASLLFLPWFMLGALWIPQRFPCLFFHSWSKSAGITDKHYITQLLLYVGSEDGTQFWQQVPLPPDL